MTRRNPFGPWATVVVEGGDLVASVEEALTARAPVTDVRTEATIELVEVAAATVPAGEVAPAI